MSLRPGAIPNLDRRLGSFGIGPARSLLGTFRVGILEADEDRAIHRRADAIEAREDRAAAARETGPVSIWSDLVGRVGGAAADRLAEVIRSGRTSPRVGAAQAGILPGAGMLPPLVATAGRVGAAAGRVLTGRVATGAALGASAATILMDDGSLGCPVGFHLNKQTTSRGDARSYCVRNRRMNFGNAKAARRSVRRLKGARKLLQDIEKMMPRRPAPKARVVHAQPTGTIHA